MPEPAHSEFRTQLYRTSRVAATTPTRDVILFFRGVLDSSANGRRSAQIVLDTIEGTQEIAPWR